MKNNKILLIILGLLLAGAIIFGLVFKNGNKAENEYKVFFCKLVGNQIVTEPILRKIPEKETAIKVAIQSLLEGLSEQEKDNGFFTEIPTGTRLVGIKEEPDSVRINLNEQFISGGGTSSMISRMHQLTNTALDAEPIRKVFIDINGKQLEVLGDEGLEISQPLSKTSN